MVPAASLHEIVAPLGERIRATHLEHTAHIRMQAVEKLFLDGRVQSRYLNDVSKHFLPTRPESGQGLSSAE